MYLNNTWKANLSTTGASGLPDVSIADDADQLPLVKDREVANLSLAHALKGDRHGLMRFDGDGLRRHDLRDGGHEGIMALVRANGDRRRKSFTSAAKPRPRRSETKR